MQVLTQSGYERCLASLTGPQGHRAWSVIVTVFGDLAQTPPDRITGAVLTRICEGIGIKPAALRVALHRLRKEGWIDAERTGRSSRYFLTAEGRAQSAAASPRIYARTAAADPRWHLLIAAPGPDIGAAPAGGCIPLGPGALLCPGPLPARSGPALALDGASAQVPDWVRARVCPPDLALACDRLHIALDAVRRALPPSDALGPVEVATLRVLIVHSWRRIVLRIPDLPPALFPEGWTGEACRTLTAELLDHLPRPAPATLERQLRQP